MRSTNASELLPYSPDLRVDPRSDRSLGPGNAGGGRWKGSSGRGEPSPGLRNMGEERRGISSSRSHGQGGPIFSGSSTQSSPVSIQPVSPALITQDLPLKVIPDLGEPDPSLTVYPQRDSREEIAMHGDNGTVDSAIPGITSGEDVLLPGHVRGTYHLNDTGSFERLACAVGDHVQLSSPMSKVDLPYVEGMHGNINVEVKAAECMVFSAGATEPVKRSAGKWKKAARLKGVNGEGPVSAPESVNTKRKVGLELAAGEVSKLRKIEVHSMGAAVLTEAVVKPRQGQ